MPSDPAALTSSPFWPSSTLGGNKGREQGGFLRAGLLAGIWRQGDDDRQTHRESESGTGRKRKEVEVAVGCLGMSGGQNAGRVAWLLTV